jgi:hypothetical protein
MTSGAAQDAKLLTAGNPWNIASNFRNFYGLMKPILKNSRGDK